MEHNNWIMLLQQGDEKGLEYLHKKYWDMICSIAFKVMGEGDTAQDIASQVFYKLWTNRTNIVDENHARKWLSVTCKNTSINYAKYRKRNSVEVLLDTEDYTDTPVTPADVEEYIFSRIEQELNKLPCKTRLAMIMRYRQGFSYTYIASILEVEIPTVRSAIRYGKTKIKEALLSK